MVIRSAPVGVRIAPAVLQWAQLRSGLDALELVEHFPHLPAWERGERQPTYRELEAFARRTHVPFGALFLPVPPAETLPSSIVDFRASGRRSRTPSGNLLDTIHLCQERQAWLADELRTTRAPPSPFVAQHARAETAEQAAARARHILTFDVDDRPTSQQPDRALALLVARAESVGVLVMLRGVVGNNNLRNLRVDEFRGFALFDPLAPLVFVTAPMPRRLSSSRSRTSSDTSGAASRPCPTLPSPTTTPSMSKAGATPSPPSS